MNNYEKNLFKNKNYNIFSGTDEVGRGALAGPIVVASVILPNDYYNPKIQDSKKLSFNKREELFAEINSAAIDVSICVVEKKIVEELNPKQASIWGMQQSIQKLSVNPDVCLIDYEKPKITFDSISITKGDDKSQSIAAASIIAKVTRDRIMMEYAIIHPLYYFELHKGYGTKKHLEQIKIHGPCAIHRMNFKPMCNYL